MAFFLDGRDKTLEEAGVRSAWKGHEERGVDRPKRAVKSGELDKVRLKRAAKGTKSIKTWVAVPTHSIN